MLRMISMDQIAFVGAVASMKSAANQMNTVIDGWASMGEETQVFDEYVRQFKQIQLIMRKYQSLLKKDVEAINKIGDSIDNADLLAARLWE